MTIQNVENLNVLIDELIKQFLYILFINVYNIYYIYRQN